ncbi:MAG: glycoside hydrolase family 3 C-terminal domain-containing protein [Marinilabiliaceae bacterium]|nr:glycoside hydrolase family 3 C-terminal domain-containing protein [Marinilabiliaceae bacterium]
MNKYINFMTISVSALFASCSGGSQSIDSQIDELYNKMTQKERIAQLHGLYMTQFFDENDKLIEELCKEKLSNGVGHFSQFALNTRKAPDQLRDMVAQIQDWLMRNTPSGIPALLHEEVLSGVNGYEATVYPQQIGLACSFNPELAEKKTFETAAALRKVGGFQALSPMVDVVRDPSFNRLEESYGEDSYLSAVMGTAFVKGLQHGNLREGVAACTKHFLGYGGGGNADKKELMEEILMPHETIIRTAGSKVVMTGYHAVDGTKCVANRNLQQEILRDYLHFDGMMVSDYGSIEQINDSLSDVERAAAALNAGNDVDFPEGNSYKHLQEAIDKGLTTQESLEKAVKRVLSIKAQVGLLDKNPKLYENGHIEFDTKAERETAYRLATQSVVLLKNDGVLPLLGNKKIALTGPNAGSMWAMLGDYTYQSMRYFWKESIEDDMHPRIVNLRDGMTNRLPEGSSLEYSRGCDWTEEVETMVDQSGDPRVAYLVNIQNRMIDSGEKADEAEALKIAVQSDVIVAAVGENAILCGENRDRKTMRLPGKQEAFVEKLIATGKPVVLVVFGGRAQVISGIAEKCAAVIQAWYPGEEGGNAVADIIYGNVSPSGKLSVSYPAEELHEPICYNYGLQNDTRIAYPFGYGLSYTTFEYTNMSMPDSADIKDERFNVSIDIKNVGMVDADEIVQLYLSPIDRSAKLKPIQLQGFKRISLKAGETKSVTFAVSPQQLGYYMNNQWNIDGGRYMIKIGASSADIRAEKELRLTGESVVMPLRTSYFAE